MDLNLHPSIPAEGTGHVAAAVRGVGLVRLGTRPPAALTRIQPLPSQVRQPLPLITV